MTATPRQDTDAEAEEIAERISRFLAERTRTSWDRETDLFDGGLSSLFAMELVVFLEGDFDVEIGGGDLRLDNFRTIVRMTGLVQRLRREEAAGG